MPYSQKKSVLILALLHFLERFSYYGIRAVIILFSIDILGMEYDLALSNYKNFIILSFILPLPAGIISDAFFKQKQGILYGALISFSGYLMLISEESLMVGMGLILILVGTLLIRTNLTVLVSRLFEKTDKNRGIAFLFYYSLINIGAFLSIVMVGYICEKYGYKYGFMITAYTSLKFLIIYYFTKDRLPLIEKNIEIKYTELNKIKDPIIESNLALRKNPNPYLLIIFISVISLIFWQTSEMNTARLQEYIFESPIISIGDFNFNKNLFLSIYGIIGMVIYFVFLLVWYFKKLGSTTFKLGVAMILIGLTSQVIANISSVPFNNLVTVLAGTIITYSVAEVLIKPFALSYITRLSDTQYSSSIVGGFMCFTGVVGHLLILFFEYLDPVNWLTSLSIISVSCILIGLLIIIFRKKLLKMSGGLD